MSRLDVKKTCKLYIGGKFPRSESGRSYPALDARGRVVARVAQASRKDLRDAVRAARSAQAAWAARTGYNRGQILYRLAEMIEDRREVFEAQLAVSGGGRRPAAREVGATVDRIVWYAGWCDKYAQVVGNLNPVAGPFFNISSPEPSGVVAIIAPERPALLGLMSRVAPALAAGNTVVVVASQPRPLAAVSLTEALATSDVPGGVVNLLTGDPSEVLSHMASHMDVNGIDAWGLDADQVDALKTAAAENVKRVNVGGKLDWYSKSAQSPYVMSHFTETKTVWHPKGL